MTDACSISAPVPRNETSDSRALLRVEDLQVKFASHRGLFSKVAAPAAVEGVTIFVERGETLGLVGESGSGKSTLIRAIVGLSPVTRGRVRYDGIDVASSRGSPRRRLQREIQLVFQDASGSLNPRMRVDQIVTEPLVIQGRIRRGRCRERAVELLAMVGLDATAVDRYAHEFSGGQRQRIGIARALASEPKLILLDEPVSALDVSVQAQILGMLRRLQQELGLTYVFVGHNLAVVGHFCNQVAVMCRGKVVESGPTMQVLKAPRHEYTASLLAAIPGGGAIVRNAVSRPTSAMAGR